MAHVIDKSPICKYDMLLRGAFVPVDAGIAFREADRASKKLCVNAALQPKYAHKRCVRTSGPHLEVFDLAGVVVVSDNSKPTGPSGGNKKWFSAQLTEKDPCLTSGCLYGLAHVICNVQFVALFVGGLGEFRLLHYRAEVYC